jgi:REP element-mobilizing transposase RayT
MAVRTQEDEPLTQTYLLTFCCHGARLHGHESGTVDREHNARGMPILPLDEPRHAIASQLLRDRPYQLAGDMRRVVLRAIHSVCEHRGWLLFAAHVRKRHVHAVVSAAEQPERIMNDFKAYASRALAQCGYDEPGRRRWSRHGSTRYLWKPKDRIAAVEYVVYGPGQPMAVYELGGPFRP